MSCELRRSTIILCAAVTLALAVITLVAMVIAPYCTGIPQKAQAYKIASLCVFLPAFYLFAWRQKSVIVAILIPGFQLGAGILFMNYINTLPIGCPG
ncbi:MAG: hypothetical protein V4459_03170 [Pseudomonadota bacterium]